MRKGYTLIELMITVAIVGIMTALVFKTAVNMKATALAGQSKANLGIIRAAINLYRIYYKTAPERLTRLAVSPEEIDLPPSFQTGAPNFGEFYYPKNPDASNQLANWQILPNYGPNYDVQKLSALSYQVVHTALDLTLNTPGTSATAEGWWYTTWNGGEVSPNTQGEVIVPYPSGKRKGEYYTQW